METLFGLKQYTSRNDAEKYRTDFQTPLEICDYMVSLLPESVKHVLEPTPGEGNLVKALCGKGFTVTSPGDFFLLKKQRFDAVVLNPPFSSKYAVLDNAPANMNQHGMRLGYYILTESMGMADMVVALMPWFTISDSDVRLRFLKNWGLKSVTALPRKTFEYARIQTVVLELVKGWEEETTFKVFDCLNKI